MRGEPALVRGLVWRRRVARLVLWIERVVRAFHPVVDVLGLFAITALLNLPRYLPGWAHVLLLVLFGGGLGSSLWAGWRNFVAPDLAAAESRLEADSGLTNRPLSVARDRPSGSDPVALALWREYQARSLRGAERLRLTAPRPGLAAADRRALRHAVFLGLFVAAMIAGTDGISRLAAAAFPTGGAPTARPEVSIQAWIAPPGYTGIPPIILKPDQTSVVAPQGSRLTVAIVGTEGVPSLTASGETIPVKTFDHESHQVEQTLAHDEDVVAKAGDRTLASWHVTIVPDRPPIVVWAPMPERPDNDQRIALPWRVTDDYGVVELRAELRLNARPDAAPMIIQIPLPAVTGDVGNRSAHGLYLANRLSHPWAGFEVTAHLIARDGLDQTGTSDARTLMLPERVFRDEIARDLIQSRKTLTAHPDDRGDALDILDRWLQRPERFEHDQTSFLLLASIYGLMVHDKAAGMIDEAQSRLWDLAVRLEDRQRAQKAAALETALKDLRNALEREALREAKNPCLMTPRDGSSEARPKDGQPPLRDCTEQEKKAAEARKEMDRALSDMIKALRNNRDSNAYRPNERQDMEQQLNEALQALREGRIPEARVQVGELLRSLEARRGERRENNNASRDKRPGPLQDMIDRENGLLERARGRSSASSTEKSAETAQAVERQQDQRVQRALGRALDEAIERLRPDIPPPLIDAREAMAQAQTKLSAGDDKASVEAERRAVEAMRRGGTPDPDAQAGGGGQEVGEPHDEASAGAGDGPGDEASSLTERKENGDPLGREAGTGTAAGSDVALPDKPEQQRNRIIRDEIRHRDADRRRPVHELNYLDQLLKGF
jgi:uncharacterized protein (TIGR02302 family)